MTTRHSYARFTVIVYSGKGLPIRPTLNYFIWNAPEAKEPHGIIDEGISDGYHRHTVISYACKLKACVTRDRELAISV